MRIRRTLATLAAAAVAALGTVTVTPGTAQAWSYCQHTDRAGYVTFYERQGYCGSKIEVMPNSGCQGMPAGWNDRAYSVVNKTTWDVNLSKYGDCGIPLTSITRGTSHPDLYRLGFGANVSGVQGRVA